MAYCVCGAETLPGAHPAKLAAPKSSEACIVMRIADYRGEASAACSIGARRREESRKRVARKCER